MKKLLLSTVIFFSAGSVLMAQESPKKATLSKTAKAQQKKTDADKIAQKKKQVELQRIEATKAADKATD